MLRLISESRVAFLLCCVATTFAAVRLGMTPDAASTQTLVGWLLATALWYTGSVRTAQVNYLVDELKKSGAKVYEGEEEL